MPIGEDPNDEQGCFVVAVVFVMLLVGFVYGITHLECRARAGATNGRTAANTARQVSESP